MQNLKIFTAAATAALIFATTAFAGVPAVPEPTSLSMLAVGGALFYGLHRLRGRK